MKHFLVAALACAALVTPVLAQDRTPNITVEPQDSQNGRRAPRDTGPTSSGDVLTQTVSPVPENGNIIVKFGETTRIYFKRALKSVRLDDKLLVKAVPIDDHTIAFTGVSPGTSTIEVESDDGKIDRFNIVSVVREPHLVKIYQRGQINQVTGERRSDSSSAVGGYVTLSCNEIGCKEMEAELQPKWPTGRP